MLALVFDGKVALRSDYPDPTPARDEALVGVRVAGVCSTDLEVMKGYMGYTGVMGHEFVGQVLAGPERLRGKRVVCEINCPCGKCDMCTGGLSNHCRDRTVVGIAGRDGAFAEMIAVPSANLHVVPDGVSDDQAVFVEPLAAAFQVTRQVTFQRHDRVVVLGDGRLGQLVARVLRPMLDKLVMVGTHPAKLEAAEKHGIETITAQRFAAKQAADVVIEATGSPAGIELAMRAVRPRGTIVLKSTVAAGEAVNLSPLVVNEVTVIGSRCGPFGDALTALAAGEVDVYGLISQRFPLSRGAEALAAAERADNIKVLIDVR